MATITVARPDVFPDGTTVEARVQRKAFPLPGPSEAPIGTAAASGEMTSGTVDLTGLADGTSYTISGLVGGSYRRLTMRTAETSTGLAAVQSAVTAPNGLAHPKWRQRRRAAGLV